MFGVKFTVERDQPVGRPLYVAANSRRAVERGYRQIKKTLTEDPADAKTFAKATTAAEWARELSFTMGDEVVYHYEVVTFEDEWEVQGDYGYGQGWETVCTEETKADAVAQRKVYDENEPGVPHRVKRVPAEVAVTATA